MQKIYLRKCDKNIEKNKSLGQEKYPYFELVSPPEQDGGEWILLGALWKTKSGKGYSGKTNDYASIKVDMDAYNELKEKNLGARPKPVSADIPFD